MYGSVISIFEIEFHCCDNVKLEIDDHYQRINGGPSNSQGELLSDSGDSSLNEDEQGDEDENEQCSEDESGIDDE